MKDIVALGELLIDFTQDGVSAQGMNEYERNPGGAPANMLVAAGNLGCSTAMIAKVGDDMHGRFLKAVLDEHGVDTSSVIFDRNAFTTLAFVNISPDGERNFSFARKPGADTCLRPDELDKELIKTSKIFHFGSLSLTDEPAKSATYAALNAAKESGVTICFDPNYRAPLWPSFEAAAQAVREALPYADIVKISDEETLLVTGVEDPVDASKRLVESGIKAALVTLGKDGALVRSRDGFTFVPAFVGNVIDTTGAGDSFTGGFLARLIQSGQKISEVSLDDLCEFAKTGNAVATLCIQKRGGISSIPRKEDVEKLIG